MRLTVIDLWRYERSTMYRAIPHLSPIGLSVIHQADEKHVECYIPTTSDGLQPADEEAGDAGEANQESEDGR